MKHKLHLPFCPLFCLLLLSLSFSTNAQQLDSDVEEKVVSMVKQVGQFIGRFNLEQDITCAKFEGKRSNDLRAEVLQTLFAKETTTSPNEIKTFINQVNQKDQKLTYLADDWYAIANCWVSQEGKKEELTKLVLKIQKNPNATYEWVLAGVEAPFLNMTFPTGSYKRIGPYDNELKFNQLDNLLNESQNATAYTPKTFIPDQLSIFLYLLQQGTLKIKRVHKVEYHFLQIPNWMFTLKNYNRLDKNSGWLISDLEQMSDEEKNNFLINELKIAHHPFLLEAPIKVESRSKSFNSDKKKVLKRLNQQGFNEEEKKCFNDLIEQYYLSLNSIDPTSKYLLASINATVESLFDHYQVQVLKDNGKNHTIAVQDYLDEFFDNKKRGSQVQYSLDSSKPITWEERIGKIYAKVPVLENRNNQKKSKVFYIDFQNQKISMIYNQ